LAGVDAEPHDQLDGLVELGRGQGLHVAERFRDAVEGLGVVALDRVGVLLALRHGWLPQGSGRRARSSRSCRWWSTRGCGCGGSGGQLTVMPIERAVPSTIFLAASRSLAFRSGSLTLAISSIWAEVTEPPPSLPGLDEAFWTPAASSSIRDAGGVLVTKVN